MTESNNHVSFAPVSALIGTITGMLIAFNTVATSQHPPQLSDLVFPPLIALITTALCICLYKLLHAIITHNIK